VRGATAYGQYAGDNGWAAPGGVPGQPSYNIADSASPYDGYAWFNTLPQLVADKPLVYYYYNNGALAPVDVKFPVPGNGKGKIWICPATQYIITADKAAWYDNGKYGLFSYVMDLDLKLYSDICAHGIGGNAPLWGTQVTKTTSVRHPSAQIFMFDAKASPTLEGGSARAGTYPAGRWDFFSGRHGKGSVIQFLDGHASFIRSYSVTNGAGIACSRQENMNNSAIWWNPNRDK
jgi:prepilin-type processing-associated H-X9-DG protein